MEKVINLTKLKIGQAGYITNVGGSSKMKTRLLELGFTKGTLVRVINVSSLKESFLIEVRGYMLALRKNAVSLIDVILNSERGKYE